MDSANLENLESQNQSHPPPPPQNQGTTFIRTCFNGFNSIVGIGILSVPYALSEGGWISLTMLIGIALVCYYTGVLLKKCMDSNPQIKSYPDIGEQAFGKKGRAIISIFMYLELFLLAVEFLIMEGDNLHKLFPNANIHISDKRVGGKQTFILLTALVVLPTTWLRSLSLLAYISAGGILASIILIIVVFWIGAFEGVGFNEKGVLWRYKGLPTAMSLYTFCYTAHAVFPTLCSSMKDKNKFPKVLLVCFILSTICYGSIAVLGYLMYGEGLLSQVTLNLPTKNVSSKIAIYATLFNPITKYAIVVTPIAIALEETLVSNSSVWMSLIIRTTLVIVSVITALLFPFFGYVMAFIGAFLSASASMLFPCLCYLKINKTSQEFGKELMLMLIILVLGSFIAVTGTFISVRDIIKHVHT